MFASTNLVIELGIPILVFLGPQYLAAEIGGGLILIVISSLLIHWTYPRQWFEAAREKAEEEAPDMEEDFDWKERIQSRMSWHMVGKSFVDEWKMVWEEILIGFTVAGFVAVLVPQSFWETLFLANMQGQLPAWLIALENAIVAPFVAAATFIGSMGKIPLATVLASNGVLFAGIMGFIYSDLMMPPLLVTNAKYYGWRIALYIAGIIFVSIVATALLLDGAFTLAGWTPEGAREIAGLAQFKIDYTFGMNVVSVGVVGGQVYLRRQHRRMHDEEDQDQASGTQGLSMKRLVVYLVVAVLVGGLIAFALTGGTA